MSWISVKDRLPEPGQIVLVYAHDECSVAWFYTIGNYFRDIGGPIPDVTHWQPLPAPPEDR